MKHQRHLKKALAIALSTLALGALPTHAQVADKGDRFFSSLDANRDGYLSRDEVRHRSGYDSAFQQADDDRDGRLSSSEFVKAESVYERQKVAGYVGDSVVTAKVKTKLAAELKTIGIGVETYRGQVILSGFVDSDDQADRAMRVASSVDGVTSVKSGMAVKK
jgi:hyperosmotically inducible protein